MEEVIRRIEHWMKEKGLSAPELARELGMNRSTVVHILGGRNKPSVQFIVNLAEYDSKLDLRLLLTGTPSSTPSQNALESHHIPEVKVVEKIKTITKENITMVVLDPDGTYKTFVEQ